MNTTTVTPIAGETDPSIVAFEVMEFKGKGDPFFGGAADDRPLCIDGAFSKLYIRDKIARFATRAAAQAAADCAAKRPGSLVGIIPVRDYSRCR